MIKMLYFYKKIDKLLTLGQSACAGRNFYGRICVHGRWKGNKNLYRNIDFLRRINKNGIIIKIIYDSFHTGHIGLIVYSNGFVSYILLASESYLKDHVYCGSIKPKDLEKEQGSSYLLNDVKLFSTVSNLELKPYKGSQLIRAAGSSCLLIGKVKNKAILKLNSGWQLKISVNCMAMIGAISNAEHKRLILGKAGKSYFLGFKPKVRGVAKNPCDHPHGGGNGKKSKPKMPVNFKARPTVDVPTTNKKHQRLKRRLFKIYV